MTKYRVSWKANGVQHNKIFPMQNQFLAEKFVGVLKFSAKNHNIRETITDIHFVEVDDEQPFRSSYHTPTRSRRKLKNNPKARIKR